MRTLRLLRRLAKWAGLLLSVSVAAIWVASIWRLAAVPSNLADAVFSISGGKASYGWLQNGLPRNFEMRKAYLTHHLLTGWNRLGLSLPSIKSRTVIPSLPPLNTVDVPLWLVLLVMASATAFLWRLDRRGPTEGHCLNCNYNMTGNVSGKCPECGTKFANEASS